MFPLLAQRAFAHLRIVLDDRIVRSNYRDNNSIHFEQLKFISLATPLQRAAKNGRIGR